MPHRTPWTLDEANAALPVVRGILDDAARALARLRDAQTQADDIRIVHGPEAAFPGHEAFPELRAAEAATDRARQDLADAVGRLEGMHVELKDIEQGLVDFRGDVGGRMAYLCWRRGEQRITHWHELDAGFSGRKRLPGLWEA